MSATEEIKSWIESIFKSGGVDAVISAGCAGSAYDCAFAVVDLSVVRRGRKKLCIVIGWHADQALEFKIPQMDLGIDGAEAVASLLRKLVPMAKEVSRYLENHKSFGVNK